MLHSTRLPTLERSGRVSPIFSKAGVRVIYTIGDDLVPYIAIDCHLDSNWPCSPGSKLLFLLYHGSMFLLKQVIMFLLQEWSLLSLKSVTVFPL